MSAPFPTPPTTCDLTGWMMMRGRGTTHLWDLFNVTQEDGLVSGHRCGSVIIHQRVQRVKLHHPQEVLPRPVPQNLKVLHIIPKPERERDSV